MIPKSLNIMMIDNDPSAHCYHEAMIEKAGLENVVVSTYLEVEEALSDIRRAIDTGQNTLPTVILVDINMPDVDGWLFVEQLKNMELPNIPTIYMVSNSLNPTDRQKANSDHFIKDYKQKYLDVAFFKNLTL